MSNSLQNLEKPATKLTLLKAVFQFILITFLYLFYIQISRLGMSKYASLGELIEGTAHRPFVYRVLLPRSASVFAKALPIEVRATSLRSRILREAFLRLNGDVYPKEALIVLIFIFFSWIGFLVVEEKFLFDLGFSKDVQTIFPTLFLILSMPFTVHFGYIYDMPQLFLFTPYFCAYRPHFYSAQKNERP